ncbi:MAG: Crp/Fnr family transcriptional regulator [Woeseiaceae bacterium]|nr:Crp/Fnr family transcriptional regulator [Woeseiaceae bacterium]
MTSDTLHGLDTLDEPAREDLLASAQRVSVEKDRFVFHAGDLCSSFLVLQKGSVRVQLVSASGREVTLYRIGPGGTCILTTSCLLGHENYPAEAIAECDVDALAIPAESFQAALDRSRSFRDFVFDGFSMRLTNVIRKIEQIAFTSIDARLAAALLARTERGTEAMTHHELAVELGTAREVVSRHLKNLESRGWLQLGRGRIVVVDRSALEALAGDELM